MIVGLEFEGAAGEGSKGLGEIVYTLHERRARHHLLHAFADVLHPQRGIAELLAMAVRRPHSGMKALMADGFENLIDIRRVAADIHLRHAVGRGGPFVILPYWSLPACRGR